MEASDKRGCLVTKRISPRVAATTAERFFRIDRAQEHLHYVTDISSESLYILDPELQQSASHGVMLARHSSSTPDVILAAAATTQAGAGGSGGALNHISDAVAPTAQQQPRRQKRVAPPTPGAPVVVLAAEPGAQNGHVGFQLPATPPRSPR